MLANIVQDSFSIDRRMSTMPFAQPDEDWWNSETDSRTASEKYAERVSSRFDDVGETDMLVTVVAPNPIAEPGTKSDSATAASSGINRAPPSRSDKAGDTGSRAQTRVSSVDSTQGRSGKKQKVDSWKSQSNWPHAQYEEKPGESRSYQFRDWTQTDDRSRSHGRGDYTGGKWDSSKGYDWKRFR